MRGHPTGANREDIEPSDGAVRCGEAKPGYLERGIEALVRRIVREELAARDVHEAQAEWISVTAWAARHGIARSTVWQYVRDGRLPSMKFGRARRVRADAVVAPRSEALNTRALRRLGVVR